jgi:hypothetical protein
MVIHVRKNGDENLYDTSWKSSAGFSDDAVLLESRSYPVVLQL